MSALIRFATIALASCAHPEAPQPVMPRENHYVLVDDEIEGAGCRGQVDAVHLERALGSFEDEVLRCLGADDTAPVHPILVELAHEGMTVLGPEVAESDAWGCGGELAVRRCADAAALRVHLVVTPADACMRVRIEVGEW